MDLTPLGIVILVVLICIVKLWFTPKAQDNFPPGPRRVPILGNLLGLVCRQPHERMREWAATYGSVTGLYIGSSPVIILNDWVAVKEAFIHQGANFTGRIDTQFRKDLPTGFALMDGQLWQEQRQTVVNSLKHLGFGRSTMEGIVLEGADSITAKIQKTVGQEINTEHFFNLSVINVLWRIIAGKTFTEEECTKIMRSLHQALETYGILMFVSLFHFIYRSFLIRHTRIKLLKGMAVVRDSIKPFVDDHKRNFNPDALNDFIDIYLEKIATTAKNKMTSSYTDEQLLLNTFDLFGAGIESSSATLRWLMFFMCKYKEVQLKVQQEIDREIGAMSVSFGCRQNLIYTEATVLESLRYSSVIPLIPPRRNFKASEMLGYTIPANTLVFANLYGLNYDNSLWDNPSQFNPERFIKDDKITKPPHFIPFACGLRACPGETLALQELSMFFTSIMQKYTVDFPQGQKEPDMKTVIFNASLHPPDHSIIFHNRIQSL